MALFETLVDVLVLVLSGVFLYFLLDVLLNAVRTPNRVRDLESRVEALEESNE